MSETVKVGGTELPGSVQRFRLTVVAGGASAGRTWESSGVACSIGADAGNDLVIDDPTVSRFHCEVRVEAGEPRVRDLGSSNGTVVDGVRVADGWLRAGSLLQLGRSTVRFELSAARNRLVLSENVSFGTMVGQSVAMRILFAQLERVAASDSTVLIEGETGTGKERAAESLHLASPRAPAPFVIVDCGALPAALLESELFGHERGAFTGAVARRVGAFEEAAGGTIFLDEIGELPLELQPKLLRVLEQRQVRRVGANLHQKVDVRVVAATNRDLRGEVNAGRFRADLYFRLAVVRIALPPLRVRPDDIPVLVRRIAEDIGAGAEAVERLLDDEVMGRLRAAAWPGNVRELRNHVEQILVMGEAGELPAPAPASAEDLHDLPFSVARKRAIEAFERRYVEAALAKHGGKAAQAASAAGIDRNYMYRILRKHGLWE